MFYEVTIPFPGYLWSYDPLPVYLLVMTPFPVSLPGWRQSDGPQGGKLKKCTHPQTPSLLRKEGAWKNFGTVWKVCMIENNIMVQAA